MLPQRINSIADLQSEQDRLVTDMRHTRKEFFRSVNQTTDRTSDFLIKNILLPVGAIGLGIFVAKKIAGHHREPEDQQPTEQPYYEPRDAGRSGNPWFSKLMLVALPIVQQFFLGAKSAEDTEEQTQYASEEQHPSGVQTSSSMSWLNTIVPMAIPLLQQYFLKRTEEANEPINVESNGADGAAHHKEGPSAIFESLYKLLPVVLPLVQQYFASNKNPQPSENARYAEATA